MKNVTITTLQAHKSAGEKFAVITAYDATLARLVEEAGIEAILVGDTLGMGQTAIPYGDELGQLIQAKMPGQAVPGQVSLEAQASVDPFSNQYADNTFDKYSKEVGSALSQVSGPMATRGGTAAQGFMGQEVMSDAALNREDVLTLNRRSDSQFQQGASRALHGMQGQDTQEALSGIGQQQGAWQGLLSNQNTAAGLGNQQGGMFNDLVQNYVNMDAVVRGTENNDLRGRGAQTSSSAGANVSACCFIFLESYNGDMPWWVRKCRDQWAPECSERREGYIRMAAKLVPWMRKSKVVRWAVDKFMVEPLTKWGGWYHKVEGYEHCGSYKPVVKFWFSVWNHLGKK